MPFRNDPSQTFLFENMTAFHKTLFRFYQILQWGIPEMQADRKAVLFSPFPELSVVRKNFYLLSDKFYPASFSFSNISHSKIFTSKEARGSSSSQLKISGAP